MGSFEVELNAFCIMIWPSGHGMERGGLKENGTKGVALLEDVALLEEVCHCGVGLEVLYMLKPCPVRQTTSCCL